MPSGAASSVAAALPLAAVLLLGAGSARGQASSPGPRRLRVVTFNVWHGLRPEGTFRLPGEDPERGRQRFALQIEQLRELDADLIFLQEVNPNPRRSRRYARALGYDQIHKVVSCGIHLGPIKIPRNMNEGLTVLARPGLGLRRLGTRRLSGPGRCWGDHLGLQTRESRYALFGQVTVDGRPLLLVGTHLHAPPPVSPTFEQDLEELAAREVISEAQREEILTILESHRQRSIGEVRTLLEAVPRMWRRRRPPAGPAEVRMVLAGDFNAEPGTGVLRAIEATGLANAEAQAEPGRRWVTWDPVRNRENVRIGNRTEPPLPTFSHPELEALYGWKDTATRGIDHLFVTTHWRAVHARIVLDRDRAGLFPSDHFGLLAELEPSP